MEPCPIEVAAITGLSQDTEVVLPLTEEELHCEGACRVWSIDEVDSSLSRLDVQAWGALAYNLNPGTAWRCVVAFNDKWKVP